ncbi:MAG: SDR family NAD(P)-dependent oxidoreductase [Thermoleophilia bacterium]|nr:SDR family NAD(P)-dependent oxidoreductase [Thermoleophilia bacterium]
MQRVAVVTGASSGIGEATARELAGAGWHCVVVARREDRLRALAEEIGGEVDLCDIGDSSAVEALAARVLERHPATHLLVNNAGMPARGTFLDVGLDLVEHVMRVNYLGGVWCARAFMPGLEAAAREGGAHIVNLVSVAGMVSFAPAGAYAASKHAQLAFSRSLSAALRGSGIAVHSVLPGFVETEGFPQKDVLKSRLLRRFVIEPEDVARAILRAVEKGKQETVVPWFPYRAVGIAQAVVPGLVGRFAGMSDYRSDSV